MTIVKVAAITLIALSLAGCGGGGSSTTTTQLSGPEDGSALRVA